MPARKPKPPARITPIGLDFETDPIELRPAYPPKPVGFSLHLPEWRAPRYFAWGHYTGGNNCSREDAIRVLRAVYSEVTETKPLLCHNGQFDLDVADEHMGCPLPPWNYTQDTMFLLFLKDPHARELGLKQAATKLLGMAPEEQDAVKMWVLGHKKQLETEFPEIVTRYGGIKPSTAGKFVAYCHGDVAGPYANGDLVRTHKLWEVLLPEIIERGMGPAYDRERRVMPILLRNAREGICTDVDALSRDLKIYEAAQKKADDWLRKKLKAPSLDLDKDAEVGNAFVKANALTEVNYTKTGKVSVSKQNLKLHHFKNPKVAAAYSYRQRCATTLETFIRPWLYHSKNGRMHTTWNQVRQAKGAGNDTGGTRTGRPSSQDPNFLNMPKPFKDASENAKSAYIYPAFLGVPELPKIRNYIVPDHPTHVFGRRDYNQQELRILGHFEDGFLLQAYLDDPRLDVHDFLKNKIITELGIPIDRSSTKNLNFGYIYGMGLGSLALTLDRSMDEVKTFRNAQMEALPGLKKLSDEIKALTRADQPIVTWGGREYFKEESVMWEGRLLDFGYKLLNYLIQGSAADITKESIIRYDDVRRDGRFALTVYDENNISVPKKALKSEMLILRGAMMSIELDVPLMSDGEWGPKLGSMVALQEPPPDLSRWGIK